MMASFPTKNPKTQVLPAGCISADNSTVVQLDPDEVFTGTWENVVDKGAVVIGIITDQDSATDGLSIEWSSDGVSKVQDDVFTISANNGKVFTFTPANAYFRVVYTNGSSGTATLDIQTVCKPFGFKSSSHRIQDSIVDDDDATLVKSVLTGKDEDGDYINIGCTNTGNLKVSMEVDAASEHKFGFQDAIGKTARWVVWDKAAAYPTWPGDGVVTVESSVAGDTSIGITVVGLDASGVQVTEVITTHAVDATTPVAGTQVFSCVYRAWVSAGSAPTGFISIDRNTTEVARIQIGFGQTQMCRWVVPSEINGVTYSGCWLKELTANVGATDNCNLYLVAKTPTDVMDRVKRYYGNVKGPIKETFTNGGTIAGIFFVAGTVITIEALALNTTAEVSASFLAGMEPA
jgi:hypothetical protein